MAAVTGSFKTYDSVGNREDLSDVITNISPTETPFISMVAGKGKADGVYHEWQTDALAAVNTANAVVEGHAAPGSTSAPTTRTGNYCQISEKDVDGDILAAFTGEKDSWRPARIWLADAEGRRIFGAAMRARDQIPAFEQRLRTTASQPAGAVGGGGPP